jgi:hypothetical protein
LFAVVDQPPGFDLSISMFLYVILGAHVESFRVSLQVVAEERRTSSSMICRAIEK